tara:strand:- start:72 stop:824 length:753 start_codon:yes stop_codon:yes gene_type:complete
MDNGNKIVKKKPGRKKKSKVYFGQPAQDAIVAYNNSDDPRERNKIYSEGIQYPFDKLVENIIHTYKFYYFNTNSDSVKHEVVSFLVLNMHKYDPDKGKAFSYFGTVAKNWLILNNNNNYKKYKTHSKLAVLDTKSVIEEHYEKRRTQRNVKDFFDVLVKYWNKNLTTVFKRPRDILIADAVLDLVNKREHIENFNKKALYVLIREMTGLDTQHITRVLTIMRKKTKTLNAEFKRSSYDELIDAEDTDFFP